MKKLLATGLIAAAMLPFAARADHDHDKQAPRKQGYIVASNGDYEDRYPDSDCIVRRMLQKNGEFKEERRCRTPQYLEPSTLPSYPVAPAGPGIVVNGTAIIGR